MKVKAKLSIYNDKRMLCKKGKIMSASYDAKENKYWVSNKMESILTLVEPVYLQLSPNEYDRLFEEQLNERE